MLQRYVGGFGRVKTYFGLAIMILMQSAIPYVTSWCVRVRQAGCACAYMPSIVVTLVHCLQLIIMTTSEISEAPRPLWALICYLVVFVSGGGQSRG